MLENGKQFKEVLRRKTSVLDLAVFNGSPLFAKVQSTSNLFKPNLDNFFSYSKKSFEAGWLTNQGPCVVELEKRLAELHNVKHCITFCSGLWGLILTLKMVAKAAKSEVIMPSMTYRRLADVAAWLNLTPHFCDIDPETIAATSENIKKCINENTAAILIAHPIVHLCDIGSLVKVSQESGIPLVFDSVEASVSTYQGTVVGSFSQVECFSMHASKLLNAFEGGYATTNDDELARNLRKIRTYGFITQDTSDQIGMNAKLNDVHAAMALASLDELQEQLDRNKKKYNLYKEFLKRIPGMELIEYDSTGTRTFKNILVKINEIWPLTLPQTLKVFHAEKLLARDYYNPPLHKKTTDYPTIYGDLSETEKLAPKFLLLPFSQTLSVDDIQVVGEFLLFVQENGQAIAKQLSKDAL